jgi:S1-C subfamily serine protease/DNA-binding NarL/FixJ family response regulator
MKSTVERVVVLESDDALRGQIVAVLSEAGYEVSTNCRNGMKAIVAFDPDAIVMGASPPQLDCCDLLSQIKGSEQTRSIRVVMLSPGGSSERTRGLDLGADDVLSLPFDSHEFLSRLRSQLRSKHVADEFRDRLRLAEENRDASRQVVAVVKEERRALRIGGLAAITLLIAGGLASVFVLRRSQQQNTRVYAAITRLQTGMLTQQRLLDRSRRAQDDAEPDPSTAGDPQKLQLRKKSEELKSKIALGKPEETSALQNQLDAVGSRLQKLEDEGRFAETVIRSYEPSVCLIHVAIAFSDRATGLKLHYAAVTASGEPTTDERGNPLVNLTGKGPEVQLDAFGTGFLVSDRGQILTNHHVAQPWWQNEELKPMLDEGLEPTIAEMTAYFPGVAYGVAVNTEQISAAADVAVVRGDVSKLGIKQIALADGRRSAVSGSPVVLVGYPTALDAILARAGGPTLQSIANASKGDPKRVMEELARRNLIRPITTQGHIGDILPDKIVYDAQTTSGGSGGPLFNNEGKVIGINFAMVRDFGGSNFAIPVGYAKSLLKR